MNQHLELCVGLKTDPVEYRYSYEWLFKLMAEEGVRHVQMGSFFEIYQLPDSYFWDLKRAADDYGITISSVFTSHRELGGFFLGGLWERVARKSYERLIDAAALLGAKRIGSNPGAVLRDQMERKEAGIACYLRNMKELTAYAHYKGIEWLTMEPMSCLAEPPTLPEEIVHFADELMAYHKATANTVPVGYCFDVSHGYADGAGAVHHGHMELFEAALPYLAELHLKNTDARFHSTFGFSESERDRGVVDVAEVRDFLLANADCIPVEELVGYFEISGPKLGRDYSDHLLEDQLRESLRYLVRTFTSEPVAGRVPEIYLETPGVGVSSSMMCADLCRLEESVRTLEAVGVDMLHFDLMDAQFTPNMPLGFETLRQLRPKTDLPFDVHLMVEDNDFFVQKVAEIGVQWISIHAESARHLERSLTLIQDKGINAGVALNPATPLSCLDYILHRLDFVVIMTVNPGFAGQALVPSAFKKIEECRAYLDAAGVDIPIQVDGNVSFQNIPRMVACGADILVAGTSSLFNTGGSLKGNMTKMRQTITEGLTDR